jgi:aryl-alcohol dehydrogenase-like predicted oxidoreductase
MRADLTAPSDYDVQRSPNILLIPGTSSTEHLHENLHAAALELPPDAIAELDAVGGSVAAGQPMS